MLRLLCDAGAPGLVHFFDCDRPIDPAGKAPLERADVAAQRDQLESTFNRHEIHPIAGVKPERLQPSQWQYLVMDANLKPLLRRYSRDPSLYTAPYAIVEDMQTAQTRSEPTKRSGTMSHFLLFYETADDYLARRGSFRALHLEHAWRAQERGELVLAGALADPPDQAVLLFQGDSAAAAEAFAEADPYVLNGLVRRWWVREWTTVVGDAAFTPVRPEDI